jgi:hypothetical protein
MAPTAVTWQDEANDLLRRGCTNVQFDLARNRVRYVGPVRFEDEIVLKDRRFRAEPGDLYRTAGGELPLLSPESSAPHKN